MNSAVQQVSKSLGPIMLDVVGTTLTAEDVRRIQHPLTGGVILFARNYVDRRQLVALTQAIHAARPGILIAVDHEGGRVQRFKTDGFTPLPAMRALGQLWDRDVLAATKLATSVGFVLASELRACGVDLSFTPVLDLDFGQSDVIGSRAFHRDPRVVTLLAKSLNHGLAPTVASISLVMVLWPLIHMWRVLSTSGNSRTSSVMMRCPMTGWG